MLNYSYMLIVPYCYIKIYRFRKNRVKPGKSSTEKIGAISPSTESRSSAAENKEEIHRKKRNVVTFQYNISIWLMETCTVTCSYIRKPDYFMNIQALLSMILLTVDLNLSTWSLLIYLAVSLGVSPSLYLLGMREWMWYLIYSTVSVWILKRKI